MTVIFLGPSAPAPEVQEVVDAEIRPPVAQGDVFRAVEAGARAIGIVDGYFNSTPAVWHKEILWAMSLGVAVFGAASMGALRAAELAAFGMRGVGWVFEAFASGRLEDDDEVAIIHAPESLRYRALSEAMVNVRCTLARAMSEGVLSPRAADAVGRAAKGLYYADRTWPEIVRTCADAPRDEIDEFERWLPAGRVDIKRADALALASAMRGAPAASPHADTAGVRDVVPFELTAMAERARRAASSAVYRDGAAPSLVSDERARNDPVWRAIEERALLEALAVERAAKNRSPLDEDALLTAIARFRDENGLPCEGDVAAWLSARHISERDLLDALAREARIAQARHELRSLTSRLLADRMRLRPGYRPRAGETAAPRG